MLDIVPQRQDPARWLMRLPERKRVPPLGFACAQKERQLLLKVRPDYFQRQKARYEREKVED